MKKMLLILLLAPSAFSMNLNEYLIAVMKNHRSLKSLEISTEAAQGKKEQGNIELSPVLTLSGSYLDDKRTNATSPTYVINHQQVRDYSLGLGKKFSSGTQAQITASVQDLFINALNPPPSTNYDSQLGVGSLGLSLSQSLLKDGFGRGTRLRQSREDLTFQLEKEGYNLQFKQVLIEAENNYWDLIYLEDELVQRKTSLERAKKIENWVRKRLNNGIGDRADLLNAQGLTAARDLQLLNTQDELLAAQKQVADQLELKENEKLPELSGSLDKKRSMSDYVGGEGQGRVLRLDSYLAVLEAKAKSIVADEVEDSLRPDLVLQGSYKTNVIDDTMMDASDKLTKTDKPTSFVGLKLTWLLDGGNKSQVRQSAKMEALAASLKKERKLLESDSSWSEIQRRHLELSKKVELAEKINQVQSAKASAERDKLSKGRSITSQVILAEQDLAEAELTLSKLKAEQRKLESQGRLFVKVSDQ